MYNQLTPIVRNLLIINFVVYALNILVDDLNAMFGLHYIQSIHFAPWQFLTYMFMHSISPMHIFSNMLGLYFFGPWLENVLTSQRFLAFYVITGMGAGVLQQGVMYIETQQHIAQIEAEANTPREAVNLMNEYTMEVMNHPQRVVVGASGAIFGILVAFALIFPNIEMRLLFLPFGTKAKYLVVIFILYELYAGFQYSGSSNIAHFAHLGGALIGFILIKFWGIRRQY